MTISHRIPRFTRVAIRGCATAFVLLAVARPAPAEEKKEPEVVGSIRLTATPKPAELPALTKISFDQALRAALVAAPGSVIKAELEVEEGNLMYSFEIVTAKKLVVEVEIDAGTGAVLDVGQD